MSLFIIAIDGPAASGKSTVSRKVAAILKGVHVDSGALYRGLTWKLLKEGVSVRDEQAVIRALMAMRIEFFLSGGSVRFTINGEDPGTNIRSERVGDQVSVVAAMPRVRDWIIERLQSMTRFGSLVVEGRDIGTVVFSDALFKFFLDADPEERAQRRLNELSDTADAPSFSRVKTSLLQRDARDSGRAMAPLARAADAHIIDTTRLSVDEVVMVIVDTVRHIGDMQAEPRPFLYRLCIFLLKVWMTLWFHYETRGERQVPAQGGCILASNHASFLDPPLVGCGLTYRFVRFMARDTLFQSPLLRWWARRVGVVKLGRTKGDIGAMKTALAILKVGGALCLFPEGTRTRDGRLQAAKGGIGFLIAKAGVPVFPVYVHGSFQAFPRGARWIRPYKITVHYGIPLHPENWSELTGNKQGYERIAELVMERIAALEQNVNKNTCIPA